MLVAKEKVKEAEVTTAKVTQMTSTLTPSTTGKDVKLAPAGQKDEIEQGKLIKKEKYIYQNVKLDAVSFSSWSSYRAECHAPGDHHRGADRCHAPPALSLRLCPVVLEAAKVPPVPDLEVTQPVPGPAKHEGEEKKSPKKRVISVSRIAGSEFLSALFAREEER